LRTPRITELDHWGAVARRFRTLADLPWPVWLDSASAGHGDGRFDILAADPYLTLRTRGAVSELAARNGVTVRSTRPPLELLREQLGDLCAPAPGLDTPRRVAKLRRMMVLGHPGKWTTWQSSVMDDE
jgi:para-aminobenzoate synthetase component 1